MKILLQRVLEARVQVNGETVGEIGRGYLLFLGVSGEDTREIADKMLEKISKLRIFEDENDKINLNLEQIGGEVLLVSQFTLYADCRKGNRPSFTNAGSAAMAEELYEYAKVRCRELFGKVECGIFGAEMKVSILNDGPFTVMLDSKEIL